MTKGNFYIVAAPSGCGKSSVVKTLVNKMDNLILSISYTTRPIRSGEVDQENYFFVSHEEFFRLRDSGTFIESATVFEHEYGTAKCMIERFLDKGLDVILDIDWQGARQIKKLMPDCVSVYLLPPSKEKLLERLQKRARDPLDVINLRMQKVQEQVSHCTEFDYLLINDDFDETVNDFTAIIKANRMQNPGQQLKYKNIIDSLLAD